MHQKNSATLTFIFLRSIVLSCALLEHIPGIEIYESLNYTALKIPPRIRYKREVRTSFSEFENSATNLDLSAFGLHLHVVLYRDSVLFSDEFSVIVGGVEMAKAKSQIKQNAVRGFLRNFTNSYIFGTLIDGIFRGTIATNKSLLTTSEEDMDTSNSIDEVFFVEPYGNFLRKYAGFHSIIYKTSSVKLEPNNRDALWRSRRSLFQSEEPSFCGLSDKKILQRMNELSSGSQALRPPRSSIYSTPKYNFQQQAYYKSLPHTDASLGIPSHIYNYSSKVPSSGIKFDNGPTSRVCNLYLQSDTFLWNHVITLPHIHGNKDLAIKEIASIFTHHVQGAQAIYQFATFKDVTDQAVFHGVSFRVDRVLINVTEEDCRRPPLGHRNFDRNDTLPPVPSALPKTVQLSQLSSKLPVLARGSYSVHNPFCAENVDMTNFLNLNSYVNHDDFCLAYVFTYRDFSGGTLGLAWVAEPGGSGGVCEKHRLMREGSLTVKKSLNTGVVTLLNYGNRISMKISQLTFAHEMGHNFGARHDDDFKDDVPSCLPSVDDPKGNYLMFASATGGDKENNNKFSSCSSNSIASLISQVIKSESNCFLTSNGSFCGNRLAEDGEQCDCGFTQDDCDDICCHPKESDAPCSLTENVAVNNITLKVHCSPSAGECCTPSCQYRNKTNLCLGADECHRSSYCLGTSAQCPPPINLPDGTPCKNSTQICKRGECLGSICERIPGWQPCSLSRGNNISPEMMCYVSCRENKTGAPCISTFELETNSSLRKVLPNVADELMRNGQGLRFQPGSPCDNYLGYCDVFLRCQSVVAEGPLARLRSLLFSPQMLNKVQTWITIHWWAMVLIVFCSITLMIVFMKVCSYRTPSSYTRHPLPHPYGNYMIRIQMESRDGLCQQLPLRKNINSKRRRSRLKHPAEHSNDRRSSFSRRRNTKAFRKSAKRFHTSEKECRSVNSTSYVLNRTQLISISMDNSNCLETSQICNALPGRSLSSDVPIPYQRNIKQLFRSSNQLSSRRPISMAIESSAESISRHKKRPTSFIVCDSLRDSRVVQNLPLEPHVSVDKSPTSQLQT